MKERTQPPFVLRMNDEEGYPLDLDCLAKGRVQRKEPFMSGRMALKVKPP